MSAFIPLIANFTVTSASTSSSIEVAESTLKRDRRLSLVLRADEDTEIEVVGFGPLSEIDVHLTLIADLSAANKVHKSLTGNDIGFMVRVGDQNKPFIHGGIAWIDFDLPYFLLQPNRGRMVQLVILNVPTAGPGERSYQWLSGHNNMLRISSVTASSRDIQ